MRRSEEPGWWTRRPGAELRGTGGGRATARDAAGGAAEFLPQVASADVDGSSVHKANIVKEYVASTNGRLKLFFLPPYSPELNPDEWVNKNIKHDRIARAVPFTRDGLMELAVEALERLKKCPGIVQGFFGDPKLRYISASHP
ncbi:MAG: transposase [Pseudonocardiaceae bacterium]